MALEPMFGYDKDGNPLSLYIKLGGGRWSYCETSPESEFKFICFQRLEEPLPPREYVTDMGHVRDRPDVILEFYSKAHAEKLREMLDNVIAKFDRPK